MTVDDLVRVLSANPAHVHLMREVAEHAGGNFHHHQRIQQRMPTIMLQHAEQSTQFCTDQQKTSQYDGQFLDAKTITQSCPKQHQQRSEQQV